MASHIVIPWLFLVVWHVIAENRPVANAFVKIADFVHRCAHRFRDSGEETVLPSKELRILFRHAREMAHIRGRCLDLITPGAGVILWIVYRHFTIDRVGADSCVTLFDTRIET